MLSRLWYALIFAIGVALATYGGCHLVTDPPINRPFRGWLLRKLLPRSIDRSVVPRPRRAESEV